MSEADVQLNRVMRSLKNDLEKANVMALNKAGRSAFAALVDDITSNYNIKRKDFMKQVKLYSATKKYPAVLVRIKGEVVGAYKFGGRSRKNGTAFTIKKSGGPKLIKSSFVATMKSGHVGIFERVGDKVAIKGRKYPMQKIKEIYGPSSMELASSDISYQILEKKFFELFKKELERLMVYVNRK